MCVESCICQRKRSVENARRARRARRWCCEACLHNFGCLARGPLLNEKSSPAGNRGVCSAIQPTSKPRNNQDRVRFSLSLFKCSLVAYNSHVVAPPLVETFRVVVLCLVRTWRPWRTCGCPTARGSSGTACRGTSGVRRRGTLRTFAAALVGPPWTLR